jgi:NAD(P)-dependent dehydrogenase (short-subunit alcohol dehydrogenase family)
MAVPPSKTNEGFEIQLGTNHVGHALLTKLLLPTLEMTVAEHNPDVRVVVVASNAYSFAPNIDTILSTEKLCETGPLTRYGASKAANVLFAAELARRYPSLTAVSLHPGQLFFRRLIGPVLSNDPLQVRSERTCTYPTSGATLSSVGFWQYSGPYCFKPLGRVH